MIALLLLLQTVPAGETLTLKEDLVLTGDASLDVEGTRDKRCAIAGNGHSIRTKEPWTGRVKIASCDIRDLGAAATFNDQGRVAAEVHALDLRGSGKARIEVTHCDFDRSSSISVRTDGEATATFSHNLYRETNVVSVHKNRERSLNFFTATGNSPAPKVFQANRVFRSQAHFDAPNWLVGGDTDAESNLFIGWRVGIFAFGKDTVVRGNYIHVLMPRNAEFPYWSQVASFTTARGALAEHNVIRDGEWIVQFVEGEFRYNLVCDINDHNLLRNGSTGRIHHNLFFAGKPDHPPGQMSGCIMIVYAPKKGEEGAEVWNNTFDACDALNVPGIEVCPDGLVRSLRRNAFVRFALGEKYVRFPQAMVNRFWNEEPAGAPPTRLGESDENLFWSPKAKTDRIYAIGVAGKSEGKDDGFGAKDVKADPKFKGPLPKEFPFADDDIKSGKVTVSKILSHFRDLYSPGEGSPLGTIGAVTPDSGFGQFGVRPK